MTRSALVVLVVVLGGCASRDGLEAQPVSVADPLPWPARMDDLAWLEGRWAGRDAAGTCHVEHWLGARHGTVFVARIRGDVAYVARVTPEDVGPRGDREVVIGGEHYRRDGDRLHIRGPEREVAAGRDDGRGCQP